MFSALDDLSRLMRKVRHVWRKLANYWWRGVVTPAPNLSGILAAFGTFSTSNPLLPAALPREIATS
jgi:hypothetical protein